MKSRDKVITRALKLKALSEHSNFGSEQPGERALARERYLKLIENQEISELELTLGKSLNQEELKRLTKVYGPFAPYVFFSSNLKIYQNYKPFSLGKEPDLNKLTYHNDIFSLSLSDLVIIPDKNLKKVLRDKLPDLTFKSLLSLKKLSLKDRSVKSLIGLETALNLKKLNISGTEVTDLSPLRNCLCLKKVLMKNCPIMDLSFNYSRRIKIIQ